MTSALATPLPRFEHPAHFYRDQGSYLTTMLRFIVGGLVSGEPVMVAVPTRNLETLRMALGGDAKDIEMYDMTIAGRNPGRIIGDVLLDFVARHPGRRARIIGEPIWAGRDVCEYPACAQHEALINVAFEGVDATVMCPYNLAELDAHVVADAKRTHPTLWTDTKYWANEDFGDVNAVVDSFNLPLAPAPVSAQSIEVHPANPDETRRFTASYALAVGLPIDRVADAVLAVDELVSNTIVHGGGYGRLTTWTDGNRAVFEVADSGFIADRLAGRRPAKPDQTHGRGLALVHRQSDLVRVHTRPGATQIRTYFNRPVTGRSSATVMNQTV
jgi:anti-sigma regulatory factor (Ser/Thr protein kinase)